jgi:hypothetical protein
MYVGKLPGTCDADSRNQDTFGSQDFIEDVFESEANLKRKGFEEISNR